MLLERVNETATSVIKASKNLDVNLLLLRISRFLKLKHCYGQPAHAQIETTTYCNAKCIMCSRTFKKESLDGKPKHMTLEVFKKVIRKLPHCTKVLLHGFGEPLLNPEIGKIIKFCKKNGISSNFATNASLLTRSIGKELIAKGLDSISISMENADPKKFEKTRAGIKFSRVTANIRNFISLKEQLGSKTPRLALISFVSKENINELPRLFDLSKDMGVKKVVLRTVTANPHLDCLSECDASLVSKHKEYGESLGLSISLQMPSIFRSNRKLECWRIWQSIYISVDGSVKPCCHTPYLKELNYGNILEQDIDSIWNGELYKRTRKRIAENPPERPCLRCTSAAY